jgi:hypothetical protein
MVFFGMDWCFFPSLRSCEGGSEHPEIPMFPFQTAGKGSG